MPEFLPPQLDLPVRLTSPEAVPPRYAQPGDAGAAPSSAEGAELAPFERTATAGTAAAREGQA